MKKLLKFIELRNFTGITKKFAVYSNHSLDFLGTIHWRNGWRCYVISYDKDIDMSVGCMEELNNFIKSIVKNKLKESDSK